MSTAIERVRSRQTGGWEGQFYIGDGWLHIVEELEARLSQLDPDYRVLQVKEKFGGLRFYYETDGDEQVQEEFLRLTSAAEQKSFATCEKCGREAHLYTDHWWRTLCVRHEQEYQRERAERFDGLGRFGF